LFIKVKEKANSQAFCYVTLCRWARSSKPLDRLTLKAKAALFCNT